MKWTVPAAFDTLEILAHPLRSPGWVAGEIPDVIPIRVMRVHQDHGVMRRAAAQGAGAGIKDAVLRCLVVRVPPLLVFVLVVPDEEIPFHRGVFGSEGMKGGNVVVRRKAVGLGV